MEIEEIAREVVDCGYRVHTGLGPGLLESVYEVVLAKVLSERGLCVERQKPVPILFEGLRFEEGFRADLLVEGSLLTEIKSVERSAPVHGKQLLTYLRLLNLPLGLLMNFGAATFKEGIQRIVNNHLDFASSRAPVRSVFSHAKQRRTRRGITMNRHVNAIAGRLSLRPPQRQSLEILDRIIEITPPGKDVDMAAALDAIRREFPSVTDFEREFPSLCFALATGVGKTRLMGAFVSYLHLAHGIDNFFVLAPNLTIYNKLVADFTPNTPKYVFKGIAEFAAEAPTVITGDTYESGIGVREEMKGQIRAPWMVRRGVHINIFNISKINSEVRGGKSPRIKRLSEYIGESYFDYLAGLPDLVLLMDESHRYRAGAGVRAINDLKPILGLELTATPLVETARGPVPFKNVIYDYPLGKAMADGFVKEPAVVTRKDFKPDGMSSEEIELLKLEDGVRLHESVKVELETYARESGNPIVKPFLLVITRDTTHAGQLLQLIRSEGFFEGRYRDKAIQVDSSRTGKDEEEMIERLLKVEASSEPTEIVIHVNMLKEGWDVTNAERKLAVILDRDALKWFKPARGQFQIFYRDGADHREYQPDFVAETADAVTMLEPKAGNQMNDPLVLAKAESAVRWCAHASNHARGYGGKPWRYLLIPHDEIAENITLRALVARFDVKG